MESPLLQPVPPVKPKMKVVAGTHRFGSGSTLCVKVSHVGDNFIAMEFIAGREDGKNNVFVYTLRELAELFTALADALENQ